MIYWTHSSRTWATRTKKSFCHPPNTNLMNYQTLISISVAVVLWQSTDSKQIHQSYQVPDLESGKQQHCKSKIKYCKSVWFGVGQEEGNTALSVSSGQEGIYYIPVDWQLAASYPHATAEAQHDNMWPASAGLCCESLLSVCTLQWLVSPTPSIYSTIRSKQQTSAEKNHKTKSVCGTAQSND